MMSLRWLTVLVVVLAGGTPLLGDEPAAMPSVRVAGIILKWVRGDKEANFKRIEPLIREAAAGRAQVVCTTECFLDGYAIADKNIPLETYRKLGEPIPEGTYFKKLSALAAELKIHLAAGLTEADGEQRYNTAVLIGPDGKLVGKYRKQNLGHESVRNTPGETSSVHETPFGRIGVLICSDRRDPALVRRYRDNKANLLICLSGGTFGVKHNDPILQDRSRENQLPIVFVHPAEVLVTAADGAVLERTLLGNALLVSKETIGGKHDQQKIVYHDLPLPWKKK